MDKLRYSIRKSFRRGGNSKKQALTTSPSGGTSVVSSSLPKTTSKSSAKNVKNDGPDSAVTSSILNKEYCQTDAASIRSAACCFMVKVSFDNFLYYFRNLFF